MGKMNIMGFEVVHFQELTDDQYMIYKDDEGVLGKFFVKKNNLFDLIEEINEEYNLHSENMLFYFKEINKRFKNRMFFIYKDGWMKLIPECEPAEARI